MLKRFLKKIPVLGPFLFAALSYPLVTHAFSVSGIAENVAFFILNIFQIIGGVLFIWAGWFTSIMLDLNYSILEGSTLINTGWTIVRDITNLGFVLVIIVIAIATILRYKAYGAGQLLTKLIAAAIIVNFSLTIAGVFLDFSHSLTRFFFAPVQGFGDHNGIGVARTLSAAFSPQQFFAEPDIPEISEQGSILSDIAQGAGSALMNIASFVFAIIFTFTAAFTLFALAILLLLRYLWLSFLLVLAPIVWLLWIVPAFKKYFSDWWSAFVKWTIFAPASAFFIYLSLISIQAIAGKDAFQSASVFFADGALAAVMKHGVQLFVLTGFFFGSLIAAQKLGVAGASGAIKLAKNVQGKATKWAGQKVKNAGIRAGTFLPRTKTGQKVTDWMQRGAKRGGVVGKFLKRASVQPLGSVINRIGARGDRLIDEVSKKKFAGLSDTRLAAMVPTLRGADKIHAIERLTKNQMLDRVPDVYGHITKENKELFDSYGRGKQFSDFEKTAMMNVEMNEERTKLESLRKQTSEREQALWAKLESISDESSPEYKETWGELQSITDANDKRLQSFHEASTAFFSKWSKGDWNKAQVNDVFGRQAMGKFGLDKQSSSLLQEAITRGIAVKDTGELSKLLMTVKGGNLDRVVQLFERVEISLRNSASEKERVAGERMKKVREAAMYKRRLYGAIDTAPPEAGVTTTPPEGGGTGTTTATS